jgi:hypothetical protein
LLPLLFPGMRFRLLHPVGFRKVCGESGDTLGQIVKKHPDYFPAPLGEAASKFYGFASERGRHVTEGKIPEHKEVELIVGIAASGATYLSR